MKTIPYSKFRHGQRVTCEIDGVKIDDAKISIDSDGTVYICQNIKKGCVADDKLLYKYSLLILTKNDEYSDGLQEVTNLKFIPRTIDDLEEGDVVVCKYGAERKVLGICGEVYFLSEHDDFSFFDVTMTMSDIKFHNYTLKQEKSEEEITELTLADVAKLANVSVEKLRIKD